MIMIKNQDYISLHVTKINDLYCISRHFMSHFTHFIVHITCIARISRMSRISHFTHSTHFMHCTTYHVILCIISCHFVIKIHSILIHGISHWKKKKTDQNGTLFNRAPPEWGILIRRIKMPPDWGIFTNDKKCHLEQVFYQLGAILPESLIFHENL